MTRKGELLIALWLWAVLPGVATEIRGRVTDAQGAAVANASILVQGADSASTRTVLSAADGGYVLENLPPGAYTHRAKKDGYVEAAQGPLEVLAASSLVVDFRLSPVRQTQEVRGAEERNPNDFVIRLDTNGLQNELARAGTNLRFLPEFRPDQSQYGEQFGYPLRSMIWATPRRPLSGFHGSVFELHQDQHLNARPFFQVGPLQPSRRNDYGFTIGGPIVRDKMSFNFAWGQVRDSGAVNGNVQVPLPNERVPLSNDPQIRSIVSLLLKAYPQEVPNRTEFTPRHLNTNAPRDIRSTAFTLHWDYRLGLNGQLAYDQQFQDYTEEPFELVIGQNPRTLLRPQNYRLTYRHTLSPQTVAQVGFDYDRLGALLTLTDQYQNLLKSAGIADPPDIDFGDQITNIGMAGKGIPRWRFENHFLFSPQISQVRGNHTLSAGFSVKRFRDNDLRSSYSRGEAIFSNDFTNPLCKDIVCTALENFRLGKITRATFAVGQQYQGFRWWEYGAYFSDRIRLRPDLTLSLGVRYEVATAPHEVNNLTEYFYHTDANNVAPQLGFAWNPRSSKTVIRGGYAVFFFEIPLSGFSRQRSNPPTVRQVVLTRQDVTVLRNPPIPPLGRRLSKSLLGPNLVVPYSHTYNLAVERDLPGNAHLQIAYLGSRTLKILTGAPLNRAVPVPGVAATTGNVNDRRPDGNILRFYNIINNSIGYLDAFQVSVNKRTSRGLAFEVRYAFSKAMDTSGHDFVDFGSSRDVSQTEEIFSDMKSVSRFDTPHSFTFNYSYELPSAGSGGWMSTLLGRWTISGTTVFRSGTPFTVSTGSDAPGFGNVDGEDGDRPNILNPNLLGASLDDPDTAPYLLYYNPTDKTKPPLFDPNIPVGGRGSLGYNTFRKDGMNNWNVALGRNFPLGGRAERQLQFRAEFFNFFNHAQFRAPGSFVTSPTFGKITDTANKGRVTQLTLKLLF
ncbi:MAG: carboxypeptidase regulatory-like domain-containing protein [Acidobacteria bacterium]|nr:carboxypeptidase regulatory-like domain-containing protein [Acidobacteriota bacterium]